MRAPLPLNGFQSPPRDVGLAAVVKGDRAVCLEALRTEHLERVLVLWLGRPTLRDPTDWVENGPAPRRSAGPLQDCLPSAMTSG